jgi:hypothetical protein
MQVAPGHVVQRGLDVLLDMLVDPTGLDVRAQVRERVGVG